MNRDQKAAVIEEVTAQLRDAEAVYAVDYRGTSVPQAAELRTRLREADTRFRVVKNTLTERAADNAGAEALKPYLEGPTALVFVKGDAASAAKALADFRRTSGLLEFKGGWMNGDALTRRADRRDRQAAVPRGALRAPRRHGRLAAHRPGERDGRPDRRPRPPAAADGRPGPGGRRRPGARPRRRGGGTCCRDRDRAGDAEAPAAEAETEAPAADVETDKTETQED